MVSASYSAWYFIHDALQALSWNKPFPPLRLFWSAFYHINRKSKQTHRSDPGTLTLEQRMTLNSWLYCFYLLSVRILTEMQHHTRLTRYRGQKRRLLARKANLHHLSCLPAHLSLEWTPFRCTSRPPVHSLLLENHSSSLYSRAWSLPLQPILAETLEFPSECSSWATLTCLSGSSSPGAPSMLGRLLHAVKLIFGGHNLFSLSH